MLKVRKQHTEMKKRSEGTNSTVEPPTHITADLCKYTVSGCKAVITPFPRKDGFHIGGDGREDGQSDGEHERHAERHDPDLEAGTEFRKFHEEFR